MKKILLLPLLAAFLLTGCANFAADLRDRANASPFFDFIIPDSVTEEAAKANRAVFDRVTGVVEKHIGLLTDDEAERYQAEKARVAQALDDYEAAMRASDPEGMAAPEAVLEEVLPKARSLMQKMARRALMRKIESL